MIEADIFIPCYIEHIYPETGLNMVRLLEKAGVRVHYNERQLCCGRLAFTSGYWDEAKAMGEKFIQEFNNDRYIVGPSTSCIGYIRNHYDKLFYNTGLHLEYKKIQNNIYEFSDFVVNICGHLDFGASFEKVITFHDSCSALREYGLGNEPRKLLSKVKGLKIKEMEERESCCGYGESFSLRHEAISVSMAARKIENAVNTGAEILVSTDSSCLMHLDAYIRKNKIALKTMHLVDVLAQGI